MSRRRDRGAARLAWLAAVLALLLVAPQVPHAAAAPVVSISGQSEQTLHELLAVRTATASENLSARSEALSGQFLGVPYGANTLVGSASEPERLVVELQRVDCFTYADYVEALKRATDREQFLDSLIAVRYKGGIVDFENRKHFFTDWAASAPTIATDITANLSADAVTVTKNLNRKDSGGVYLPGIPVVTRAVSYIPSQRVDDALLSRLRTGDYIGAYAPDGGLDVTHVGIFIDTPDGPVFRNASSLSADNRVVDSSLRGYLQTVPGIVVLRPHQ